MTVEVVWQDVASLDAIPEAKPFAAFAAGQAILLVRTGDAIRATSASCPHKFTSLEEGTLDGCMLTCPLHEATFDIRDGNPASEHAWAGKLPVFPVKVEAGRVLVQVPPVLSFG